MPEPTFNNNPVTYEHLETYANQQARANNGESATNNETNTNNTNNQINNIDITNPFAQVKSTNSNESATNNQTNRQTNSESANQPTLDDIVNQKVFGELSDDLINKAINGEPADFKNSLLTMSRNIYKQAIQDANALMEAKLTKFKSDVKASIESDKKADSLVANMHQSLEFTKDPAIEPVARQVLANYIRKGLGVDEAIGATRQYFANVASSFNNTTNKPESSQQNSRVLTGEDALNKLFS